MNHHTSIAVLALIGVVAGTFSGLFGIGGGLIMIPALMFCAGFSQLSASGTSLAVLLVPVGLAAVIEYYRNGNVDIRAAFVIALCFFCAAGLSAHFANRINPSYMKVAFGAFMSAVGGYMVVAGLVQHR